MIQTATALYSFFSGFGIPAYVTDTVPDNARMPYITYDLVEPEPLATAYFTASVWYRDTGFAAVSAKADEIKAALKNGKSIPTASGSVKIFPSNDSVFARIVSDPNPETKRLMLSLLIHCNTN